MILAISLSSYDTEEESASLSSRGKAEIRAAVAYLLNGAAGRDRGDIVREIIEIVNDVARGLAPGRPDPFEDELPGG